MAEEARCAAARARRSAGVPRRVARHGELRLVPREEPPKWLLKAEELAELPKLERGTFHPYRRLWATERKSLPDVDVAHAAGWKDRRAMKLAYQKADPATVLAAVEHVS